MASTVVTLTPELEKQLAQGYSAKGEANPIWTLNLLAGAGAFNSNASDMMKFIRANLEDSSELSRSLKKMHAKQGRGVTGIGWIQATFFDRFVGNRSIVWHDGGVGGYASYLSIDSKNKTGLVMLSNKSVSVTMLGIMLTRQVRTQSWSS